MWFLILPFTVTSKNSPENQSPEMFFEGQSFLQNNVSELSTNSEHFWTDCQTQLWFKPTKRQGMISVFAGDMGTWTGIGLKDGYLR